MASLIDSFGVQAWAQNPDNMEKIRTLRAMVRLEHLFHRHNFRGSDDRPVHVDLRWSAHEQADWRRHRRPEHRSHSFLWLVRISSELRFVVMTYIIINTLSHEWRSI